MYWPTYLSMKLGLIANPLLMLGLPRVGPGTYQVSPAVRLKMRPFSADAAVAREVFALKDYERPGFEIEEDDTVVDIGGHIGAFACYAARFARRGRVVSCEPVPDNFELLRHNVALNGFENVTTRNRAVTAAGGERVLHLSASNTGAHSVFPNDARGVIKVPSISLADLLEEEGLDRVDFLKLDAEGAEYEILLGAGDALLRRIDRIALEFHDCFAGADRHLAIVDALRGAGFQVEVDEGPLSIKRLFRLGMLFARR